MPPFISANNTTYPLITNHSPRYVGSFLEIIIFELGIHYKYFQLPLFLFLVIVHCATVHDYLGWVPV